MTKERSSLELEFDDNAAKLDDFITQAEAFSPITSMSDVVKRYIRDCNTLKVDMFAKECPSLEDINDLHDQFASLEVRFHDLKNYHQ